MNEKHRILLEIALESADDAVAAVDNGADRIELCAGLDAGGLTPSVGTLLEIRQLVDVPIFAMLRPRNGGFCYSQREFDAMQGDTWSLCGGADAADGIVVGILNADG